ncbi:MAG: zinc metalloprotease HtpX [Acidobacteriota bacterium]
MANSFKTAILLGLLTGLILVVGSLLGGQQGMLIALVFAGIMNFVSYWFSDKIVLAMYRAKEIQESEAPDLHSIVGRLAARASIPKPKIYIMPAEAPNAFATGRNPAHAAVAVTGGLLNLLTEEELEGVIAHEMAHVRNRDILIGSIAATIAGAIMFLANMARWAALFGGYGGRNREEGGNAFALLFMAILAPIAAVLIQMAIARSREYQADASGANFAGNPQGLARALEKLGKYSGRIPMEANPATSHMFIVKPLSAGSLLNLFSTHPPIEERIRRLLSRSF